FPPYKVAALGLSRTFQNLALFRSMSVVENILVGRHIRSRSGFVSTALKLPSMRAEERSVTENAWRWIFELNLEAVAHEPVVELPLGTQKRVELARALATDPQLLL